MYFIILCLVSGLDSAEEHDSIRIIESPFSQRPSANEVSVTVSDTRQWSGPPLLENPSTRPQKLSPFPIGQTIQ